MLASHSASPQDANYDSVIASTAVDDGSDPDVNGGIKRKLAALTEDHDSEPRTPLPASNQVPGETVSSSLTTHRHPLRYRYAPSDHPFNRHGFRYTACGSDPYLPRIQYRIIDTPPFSARLGWSDISRFCEADENGTTISNAKGYRMGRVNCPLKEGKWYFEVHIDRGGGEGAKDGKDGSHVRLGIARREASVNAPVGFDGYSYGYRDHSGQKVTLARPESYGDSFQSGDVIGVYLSLPKQKKRRRSVPNNSAANESQMIVKRDRLPIRYKDHLFFESTDYLPQKEYEALMDLQSSQTSNARLQAKNGTATNDVIDSSTSGGPNKDQPAFPDSFSADKLPRLKGSSLIFYKNGVCQGVAFRDLYSFLPLPEQSLNSKKSKAKSQSIRHDDGSLGYYAAVSMYGGGKVTLNLGPEFKYPPPTNIEASAHQDADQDKDKEDKQLQSDAAKQYQTWRPYSERWSEYLVEEAAQDLIDEIEADLKAEQDASKAAAEAVIADKQKAAIRTLQADEEDVLKSELDQAEMTEDLLDHSEDHRQAALQGTLQDAVGESEARPMPTTTVFENSTSDSGLAGDKITEFL